jgi:hypothetical protein
MSRDRGVPEPPSILERAGYELEVEDTFAGPALDERLWFPYHLAGWSSREASAGRYEVGGGLRLRIDADQPPWSPEFDGGTRASSLQTGVFSGPLGSGIGQVHFRDGLVVREEQGSVALYTPRYGLFEVRCRAIDDPANMVALWMIGFGDEPAHTAEICVCEIFGRNVGVTTARVGMGVHPFGDPSIEDEFAAESVAIDARETHTYSVRWTSQDVAFYVDDALVKVVGQSPAYPMQFMLDIYEFSDGPGLPSPADRYPKVFAVDWFRGYRPVVGPDARPPAFRR